MSDNSIQIEVAFALPQRQTLKVLSVPAGTTVEQAIELSDIKSVYPSEDIDNCKVGIWSRVVKRTDQLKPGDRIEIYRPLIADPKEVRKRRAEKAIEEGRADKVTGGRPNPLKSENKDPSDA